MAGVAVAQLGISIDEFYEMTPREFHFALESLREYRQAHSRELYEIARYQTWLGVRHKYKPVLNSPTKLGKFDWESGVEQQVQSMEQMKNTMLGIATAHNASLKKKGK